MDSIGTWFNHLQIVSKCIVILFSFPLLFLLVGVVVFMMESPGPSFWGTDKPKWWQMCLRVLGRTMAIGFVSCTLLGAIFGSTYLLYRVLSWIGLGQVWVYPAAFIICLIGVLFGVLWWFERH